VRSIGTSTTSGTRPDTSGGCLGPRSIPPPSHFSCDPERSYSKVAPVRVRSSLERTRAVFCPVDSHWLEYPVSGRIAATKVDTVSVSTVLSDAGRSRRRAPAGHSAHRSARAGAETRGDRTTTYREMDMGFCPEQAEAEIRVWCDARHRASAFGLPDASRSIRCGDIISRSESGVEECVHASRSGRLSQATKQNFETRVTAGIFSGRILNRSGRCWRALTGS